MKRLVFSLLLLPVVISSCSSVNDLSNENLALIESYIQAVENLDYETMTFLLDEDHLGLGPSFGDSIGKAQAVENWKHNVENLYEKIDYTLSRNAAITITSGENQGDWITNWAELYITYKDNRGAVAIWADSIYQIKNDMIVKGYTFYNEADTLEQLCNVFINPNDLKL